MPAGKIGINGFGRIGRLVLRAAVEKGATVGTKLELYCNCKNYFFTHCYAEELAFINHLSEVDKLLFNWGNEIISICLKFESVAGRCHQ